MFKGVEDELKQMHWEGERVPKIKDSWMLERCKNLFNNVWLSMSKSRKSVKTDALQNIVFFDGVFKWILGGFGDSFGTGLESFWRLLGLCWSHFFRACILNLVGKLTFYHVSQTLANMPGNIG